MLRDKLRYLYGRFVGAVAEGRAMTKDQVDAVGRGHVWTGAQAQPNKLVDRFGGLGDVIDEAKRRMKLSPSTRVQLYELPSLPPSLLSQIAKMFGLAEAAQAPASVAELPAIKELLRGIPASILVSPDGAQARLPYDLSWE